MSAAAARTALVTGASSGIGRAIAEAFARDGIDLVLASRDEATLHELACQWRSRYGVEVVVVGCDLSATDGPEHLVAAVRGSGREIDFLVNNAGVGVYGVFADTSLDDELAMLRLNIDAPTILCKRFLPELRRRRGRIMNVASVAAFQPGPYMAAYYATKAYLLHFSEALAAELAGTGVSVTTFCPGPTASGFQSRAEMQHSRLVSGKVLADASQVGMAGYRAMHQGRRLAVPGLANRMNALAVRLLPRAAVARVVLAMSKPA